MKELKPGIIYVPDDIDEARDKLAHHIAITPMQVRNLLTLVGEEDIGYEIVADIITTGIFGEDEYNLLIPKSLVSKELLNALERVNIAKGVVNKTRDYLMNNNPNFEAP